jgi:peptidoglycan/xylan/chitin deacetylase (PgdA/CDA1 family)
MLGKVTNGMRNGREDEPSDVLVLAYHAVSDEWDAVTTVTPAQLDQQVRYLLARGYRSVTFDRALTAPPAGRALAITFDDAHRSVFEVAFPMLRALGAVATVFAPTDYIGTGEPTDWEGFETYAHGPHSSELICMDWDQLRTVVDAGWEVGSHTRSHPHLTRLTPSAVRDELIGSRELLETRLQRPCRTLAYPYSDLDGAVVEGAHASGYGYAATIPVGYALSLPLRWSRVGIFRCDSMRRFKLLTSHATRGFLASSTGTTTADVVRGAKSGLRHMLAR